MQQNVELQRELETLRAKLECTFALLNEKLDQQQHNNPSSSMMQMAIEQMRRADSKLQELQMKNNSQQEENDLLRYIVSEKTDDGS
jgi:predicted MPP superfamily phosphohydrolase